MHHRKSLFSGTLFFTFIMSMVLTLLLSTHSALAGVVYYRNPDGSFLINPLNNSKVVGIRYGLMGGFVRSDKDDGVYGEFDARLSSNVSKYYGTNSVFSDPTLDVRLELSTKDIAGFDGPIGCYFGVARVMERDAVTGEVKAVESTFVEDEAANLNVTYLGETLSIPESDDPYEDLSKLNIPEGQTLTRIKGSDFFEEIPGERNNGLFRFKDTALKPGYYLISWNYGFTLLQDRSIDRADEMMLLHIVDYDHLQLAEANYSEQTNTWETDVFDVKKELAYQTVKYTEEPYIFQVRDLKGYQKSAPKPESLQMTYYGYDEGELAEPQALPRFAVMQTLDAANGIYSFSTRTGGTYLFTIGNPADPSVREHGCIIEVEEGFGGLKVLDLTYQREKETYIAKESAELSTSLFVKGVYGAAIEVYEFRDDEEYGILPASELEVTYYGNPKSNPKQLQEDGTFLPRLETEATLEELKEPHDGNKIFFTPDQEGVYLISKKGITDEVNASNQQIRKNAIYVSVNNHPGFYESIEGGTGRANFAKECRGSVATMCINHLKGTEETRTVYIYSKSAFYKGEVARDKINSDYSMEGDASKYVEFGPVEGKEGWYKLTLNLTAVDEYKWINLIFDKSRLQNMYVYINVYTPKTYYYRMESSTSFTPLQTSMHNYWRMHRDYLVSLGYADETGIQTLKGEQLAAFRFYHELSDSEMDKRWDPQKKEYIVKEGEIYISGSILAVDDNIPTEVVSVDGIEYLKLNASREGLIALSDGKNLFRIASIVKSEVILSTTPYEPEYGAHHDPFVEHLGAIFEGIMPNPLYLLTDYDNKNPDSPYGIELDSVKIVPYYDDKDTDVICNEFISVDKEHPIKGNEYYNTRDRAIGYPVYFTDQIDRPFNIRIEYLRTGQSKTQNLYYYYMQLRSLSIANYPKKRDYQAGELFDATGFEVNGAYRGDNSSATILLDPSLLEITINGEPAATHKLTGKDTDVTITFLGQKLRCGIWVTPGDEDEQEGGSSGQDGEKKDPAVDGKDGANDGRDTEGGNGPGKDQPSDQPGAMQEAAVGSEVVSADKSLGYMVFAVIKKGDAKHMPEVALKGLRGKQIPKKIKMPGKITAENGVSYQVTKIGNRAFAGQKKIRKIDLSKCTKLSIGSQAFFRDKSLKEIRVRASSLKKLHKKAFAKLPKKTKIVVLCEGKTKKAAQKKFAKAGKKLRAAKAKRIVCKRAG
ncbi:MAG: leucine-rich repeat domain-containing protein [Lachnospiraceae bacterium]|nr:leucine-rich repeat domain-containing protein [Lachnospiraceae bacterium]